MAARPAPQQRRKTILGDHPVYESSDIIGHGSFGIIRKVVRKADGQVLARKELNYGRMDERDLKQLTEEVNILETLGSNDNIVRYYERFVDKPNNMLYILMEFCAGGDLAGVIQRCRKTNCILPEDVVWAYLTQITLALHDCHSETDAKGKKKPVILHRDIKPENVFLDERNNLKLGDFGLSKAMQQAAMTQTYVGTPYYMSPELINGMPYDVKSDIWALGCLIYELCAGHPPFHEARTQPELAVMIREGKIPDLPKPYSSHLGQVVKAMLRQNPKERPNTSQIKSLDSVKLQIRALELRKASRELRMRDQHVTAREKDLLAREAAVLAREQAVCTRENAVRAAQDNVKDSEAKLTQAWALYRMQLQQAYQAERENIKPHQNHQLPNLPTVEPEVVARVASRPSMVPRRPLDERRSSTYGFPRTNSNSSLMSLDDTPSKERDSSPSLRRRLASKSMHNLQAGSAISSPSRTMSASNDNLRAAAAAQSARKSPSLISIPIAAPLPTSISVADLHSAHSYGGMPSPSPTLSIASAPSQLPSPQQQRHWSSPVPLANYNNAAPVPKSMPTPPLSTPAYDDDVPSPFIKKPFATGRQPTVQQQQPSTSSAPRPGKPPILHRLLSTRAAAAAGFGRESPRQDQESLPPPVPSRRASLVPRKSIGV
ncbi:G2-specific serine/threonine protein kinase [Rhodotorula mucilaginosa]|uniref:non-specific serine/threonine protein kinase n=1 Tax=Rhodotorula mucilaginosa TaxID=5537 RepID=A0A9P6W3V8_RHOMI|nr:G2-specific serine/threonine protein kinase [Rhodotorula mucilaginosa]